MDPKTRLGEDLGHFHFLKQVYRTYIGFVLLSPRIGGIAQETPHSTWMRKPCEVRDKRQLPQLYPRVYSRRETALYTKENHLMPTWSLQRVPFWYRRKRPKTQLVCVCVNFNGVTDPLVQNSVGIQTLGTHRHFPPRKARLGARHALQRQLQHILRRGQGVARSLKTNHMFRA